MPAESHVGRFIRGDLLRGERADVAEGLVEFEMAGQVDEGASYDLAVGAGAVQRGEGDGARAQDDMMLLALFVYG